MLVLQFLPSRVAAKSALAAPGGRRQAAGGRRQAAANVRFCAAKLGWSTSAMAPGTAVWSSLNPPVRKLSANQLSLSAEGSGSA